MKLEHTHKVTPELGPRPAGSPDACFYCPSKVGEEHADDCVIRQRTVVLEMKVKLVVSVPESWTQEQIEFHRNDSSWCCSNALNELERMEPEGRCICDVTEFRYLGEADEEQSRRIGALPEEHDAKA